MKKHLLSLLFSLVASSCLLAQSASPSDPGSDTPAAPVAPVQHLEATYNIASKQSKPMGSVTWVADLQNDTAPYSYNVTVTLQNDTNKVFSTWNLAMIFLGSVTAASPEIMIYAKIFSDGPAFGYAVFGGIVGQGTTNLAPHGSITFNYTYQLPVTQQTIEAPSKIMLSRGIS
ncbi:MAG: hypothetical protein NT164_02830 [Verrucomicrobiae bacterium]|nr:hypothetical protein [Verrucomicrobiae bacterium]